TVGPKELLVFDTATGRCLRRLGEPLPDDTFRWMHPIRVERAGESVLMQAFAVTARPGPAVFDPSPVYEYPAIEWDPIKKANRRQWTAHGERTIPPRHFAPYVVTLVRKYPRRNVAVEKVDPAAIRCYSLADGKLVHELRSDLAWVSVDRIEANFLLTEGYNGKWVSRGNTSRYTPYTPFDYDLWELPSREKVPVFEQEQEASAALGPAGQFILRIVSDTTFEIYEPFVLRRAVAKISTPSRPVQFEFSPDGSRLATSLADASIIVWDAKPWQARVREQIAKEVPTDLTALWEDLAKDTPTGLRAAHLLSAVGDKAVTLLDGKIATKKAPDPNVIRQWIAELDTPVFADREKAEKNLRDLSSQAEPLLRKALQTDDASAELKRRVEHLLKAIEERRLTVAELRELRAVQALRWTNDDAARVLLAKWARGDPAAALTRAAKEATSR
ncbi:MAG TPA: hypothetical protein VKE94_17605, partial [Gemmataceae bacterium]|nr:hypothetical protein [Gemmataceae bacterium]